MIHRLSDVAFLDRILRTTGGADAIKQRTSIVFTLARHKGGRTQNLVNGGSGSAGHKFH